MITDFSVRHPVTVSMIMLGIVILGAISLDRLGTDLLPSIYNPRIVVELQSGERSPQEMEERYARQLEGELRSISRAVDVQTVCRMGRVLVTTTFAWGADMDFALLDVQKKIARYEAQQDVDRVTIARYDPQAEPIMIYALTGNADRDVDEVRRLAENVIRLNLERLDGVARVQVYGGVTREVSVQLNEYLLSAYNLTATDITGAIRQSNANASGGTMDHENRSYTIKGIGQFTTIDDVGLTVVGYKSGSAASSGDSLSTGSQQQGGVFDAEKVPIYLTDVATVNYMPEERTDLVRLDAVTSLGMYIYKEAEDNTVRVAGEVTEVLAQMQVELPGLAFTPVYSQADFISSAIGEVESTALFGIGLAVLVLFAFLRNAGATLIVSLAIPLSVLATFTLMYFQELTLNIMTLGGLALGAGMLVDNAIVVIENIFRRRQLGESAADAAIQGTSEVGVPIIAATLTTIIVFLPIVYVQGIAAELFKEQAWVVAYALLSSLVVAFLFIPAASARLFARKSQAFVRERMRFFWYERFLVWVLDHRAIVLTAALLITAGAVALIPSIGAEFIPRSSENQLQVDLDLQPGVPLEQTEGVIAGVEARIRQTLGDGVSGVFSTANVNTSQSLFQDESQESEHLARLTLTLDGSNPANMTPDRAIALLRPQLSDIPDVEVSFRVRETSLQQTVGAEAVPVAVEIRGTDLSVLKSLGERVQEALAQVTGIHTVETSAQSGRPEINLQIDRLLAASFGLTVQQIGDRIRERLSGDVVAEFFGEGEDRNIRVAFPRVAMTELSNMPLQTSDGAVLRLKDIAEMVPGEGPRTIQRHNQSRIVMVTGQLEEGISLSQSTARVTRILAEIPLPNGYQFTIGGTEQDRRESFGELRFALMLSVILVYMVMASLFESFLHPFTILLTLPLAGVGVVGAFVLTGEPFSVMALIGVVMLGGIAVNDSIVLVDYINRLREAGADRHTAVVQGARDRLRPILMTSMTTILALLPLTIGLGEAARLRAPMAIAVIGGLITSTVLTLVVIPAVYDTLDRFRSVPADANGDRGA
ncbi:MAG: efflux RND transporter permease subunit [Candidatus Latescibacteria bacterium]|nr:efflux RND transporter permease subunit [Candidatus Latescibacterota bacterium]